MVMAVRVIVVVIMPVVMSAVRAVNMRGSGRLGVTVVTVVFMVAMCMAAVVMTRVRGCAVSATLRFKSFVYGVHDQVHGTQQVGQHMVGLDLQVVGL
jgi:hypothetical protein